jgi:hypothetical protein
MRRSLFGGGATPVDARADSRDVEERPAATAGGAKPQRVAWDRILNPSFAAPETSSVAA